VDELIGKLRLCGHKKPEAFHGGCPADLVPPEKNHLDFADLNEQPLIPEQEIVDLINKKINGMREVGESGEEQIPHQDSIPPAM
jgi:hypothetical protein